ncbi:MAG: S-layer homology domain-containing protein [Desulfocucumaceae bacterium]
MRRFGRIFLVLTAMCLTMLLLAGAALATPAWKGHPQGKDKPVKAKMLKFRDISGHWAEQNIMFINYENVIKGYEDNTFQPNKPVNKEEAITMIVRMVNGEVSGTTLWGKQRDMSRASSWARSYLNQAVEKGILSEVELNSLAFNKPAQRYEVAMWLVRALGLEDKAIEKAGADLDFRDEEAIPAWARGYVEVAVDEGIIKGFPDHVFRPGTPVTRAEMATMLVKAREGFDIVSPRQGFSFIRGTVTDIEDDSITIRKAAGKGDLTAELADEALVYLDGKLADLEEIDNGDTAAVLLDSDRKAIVVIARSTGDDDSDDNDSEEVEGTVESVSSSSITVKVDGQLKVYTLDDDVDVELDGNDCDVDDIKKGYEVELTLEDDKVVKIDADSDGADISVSGVLESVGSSSITVKVGSVLKVYTLSDNVDVTLDGRDADKDDLRKGYDVELTIENGKVVEIDADSNDVEISISGVVESVGSSSLTVKVGSELKVYTLDDNVDVTLDGRDADVDDLDKGYEVELTIEDSKVTGIEAETETVSGEVESVGGTSITVKVGSELKVYGLASGVDVIIDGSQKDLDDLAKGMDVELTFKDDKVVKVVAD